VSCKYDDDLPTRAWVRCEEDQLEKIELNKSIEELKVALMTIIQCDICQKEGVDVDWEQAHPIAYAVYKKYCHKKVS
jgi:hypothetical protein